MPQVLSVNLSARKGEQKHPVPEIRLKLRHGIVGDAHAGDWHRQISLLAEESVDRMRPGSPIPLTPGDCAIRRAAGRCVMPTEGVFAVVVREGAVRAGDEVEVLE